jgi:hypothetical protein
LKERKKEVEKQNKHKDRGWKGEGKRKEVIKI